MVRSPRSTGPPLPMAGLATRFRRRPPVVVRFLFPPLPPKERTEHHEATGFSDPGGRVRCYGSVSDFSPGVSDFTGRGARIHYGTQSPPQHLKVDGPEGQRFLDNGLGLSVEGWESLFPYGWIPSRGYRVTVGTPFVSSSLRRPVSSPSPERTCVTVHLPLRVRGVRPTVEGSADTVGVTTSTGAGSKL